MNIGLEHYLVVSAVLFALGLLGVITRRNILVIYMSLELMLNAANLALVAFSRFNNNLDGQVMVFFIITVAAAEVDLLQSKGGLHRAPNAIGVSSAVPDRGRSAGARRSRSGVSGVLPGPLLDSTEPAGRQQLLRDQIVVLAALVAGNSTAARPLDLSTGLPALPPRQ